jgi:membrane protease YdiL (CAAX protease family)
MNAVRPDSDPVRWGRPEILVLAVVACLIGFYYGGRADTVGTRHGDQGWSPVTPMSVPVPWHFALSAVVLGVIPVAAARRLTGKTLPGLGLGPGDIRAGLRWTAVGLPLAVLAGKIASGSPTMAAVYPLDPTLRPDRFVPYAGSAFLYYGAWEVLFRGVLLFGLRDRLGERGAIALQTALSVTAHFGRPLDETAAALPAGILFGWIALRTRSVWPIAIVHWTLGTATDWFLIAGR